MMNTMTLHIPDSMAMQAKAMGIYHEQAVLSAFQKMIDEQQEQSSELQRSFVEWELFHQEMVKTFDEHEMTDEQYDEYWVSLRDKNDFGQMETLQSKPKRQLGGAEGSVLFMADDFDAPLNDFKNYM